jgi:parallel beta-helix repeat protein
MNFVLLVFCVGFVLGGCDNPLSPFDGTSSNATAAGVYSLMVGVAGESGAQARTALPSVPVAKYRISVSGGTSVVGGYIDVTGTGPYLVPLTVAPAVGDVITVDSYDSLDAGGVKNASGSYTLPLGYVVGTSVSITLYPLPLGTGDVDLSVSFSGTNEITVAELTLYKGLANYPGTAYATQRYRNDGSAGVDFEAGPSVPIKYDDLPSDNYVLTIDFFRGYTRVSHLVQTIIVQSGLTTDTWVETNSKTLTWNVFASSNADLSGISIEDGTTITLSSGEYSYSMDGPSGTPANKNLTVTADTDGQIIAATLNGTGVTLTKSGRDYTGILSSTNMKAVNSIVITVTAQDGVTQQTYTVTYTYVYSGQEWYVDGTSSPSTYHFSTVNDALNHATYGVKAVYNGGTGWPGGSGDPIAARINISEAITEAVNVSDTSPYAQYPLIILAGSGQITATSSNRPLTITNAAVILEGDLTLTGGTTTPGGGVYVDGGTFTMSGGTIRGNTTGKGGGVCVYNGTFTMNGGTIRGNRADNGGGVYVAASGVFTMNGGTISGHTINLDKGAGVYVAASGVFTMNGGTISGNTAYSSNGGGVFVAGSGDLTMYGGTISGNRADNGGGVYLDGGTLTIYGGTISGNTGSNEIGTSGAGGGVCVYNGTFTMNGGTIRGNNANTGGGVYFNGTFTMNGGTISGNTATNDGGGVCVAGTLTMSGGTISGNNATAGGGVYLAAGSFDMSGGTISNNTASDYGGGVYASNGTFTMSGGTISGNTATNDGGGVYVDINGSGSFTMSVGTISGNSATNAGGGVYVIRGTFDMSGGTISGNTATNTGGGVNVRDGAFTMSVGTISGNSAPSGGGVFVFDGTFDMNGGTISGNTAANAAGGVYVGRSTAIFTMSGGTISGNNANAGGGVFGDSGTFNMSGGASVSTDNEVYLSAVKTITITGDLSGSTVARIKPSAYTAGKQVLDGTHVSTNHTKFTVTPNGGTNWTINASGNLEQVP